MIDLHCHVLPGIDDGPSTIEDSLALADAALAAGTRTLVATPHVSWRYRNDAATIAQLVDRLNARLKTPVDTPAGAQAGTQDGTLEIVPGAEVALTRVPDIAPEERARLRIGGSPWLLIEPPVTPTAVALDAVVADLHSEGHRILLAHPERCPAFHRDPRLLKALVDAGVLTSITAGAFVGRFGGIVRRFALGLLEAEMVHNVASDAHNDSSRPPGMATELERAGLGPLTDWLTVQVPSAILEDRQIPPRPAVTLPAIEGRRGWWKRHRRIRPAS